MNGDTEALRNSDSALAWSPARQGWSKVLPGDDAVLGTGTRSPTSCPTSGPASGWEAAVLSPQTGPPPTLQGLRRGQSVGLARASRLALFFSFYCCPSAGEEDPAPKVRGRVAPEAITRGQPDVLRAELGEAVAALLGLGFAGDSPGPSKGMPTLSGSAQPRPGQGGATGHRRGSGDYGLLGVAWETSVAFSGHPKLTQWLGTLPVAGLGGPAVGSI